MTWEFGAPASVEPPTRAAHEIVEAAELHAREVTEQLGQRRRELEQSIRALEAFEGDYRGRLRGSVEALLQALEQAAPNGPLAPPGLPELLATPPQDQPSTDGHTPSDDPPRSGQDSGEPEPSR